MSNKSQIIYVNLPCASLYCKDIKKLPAAIIVFAFLYDGINKSPQQSVYIYTLCKYGEMAECMCLCIVKMGIVHGTIVIMESDFQ